MPDVRVLRSTHTCDLDIPHLPNDLKQAHVVPGLGHTSLISARVFCNKGCTVTYTTNDCVITSPNDTVLLKGQRDPTTKLWLVPLTQTKHAPLQQTRWQPPTNYAHNATDYACNVHTITHITNRVKYMHQALFCPPIRTLLRAINLGFLQGFPFLTSELVTKHLAPSPATAKGRMKFHPAGYKITRHHTPPGTKKTTNLFCYAALADKQHGTFYTDCTGALPGRSIDGFQYFFVAYDYDTNYIFALPIATTSNDAILTAFTTVFNTLTEKGYTPRLNITDNQASVVLKQFANAHGCDIQFVEPYNHRVNAAECAIQTFKNHFISGLCITDKMFPFHLWSRLAKQAELTCNILRRSRLNPTISAYHQLHGAPYDWNFNPLAPPGTRALIYNPPAIRTSWGARGLDAWYCGPSLDHYRGCIFYVPQTSAFRISATYQLFPTHCTLPVLTPTEHIKTIFQELRRSIQTRPHTHQRTLAKYIRQSLDDLTTNPQQDDTIELTLPWPDTKGEDTRPSKGADTLTHTKNTRPTMIAPIPTPQPTIHPIIAPIPTQQPTILPTPPTHTLDLRRSPRLALITPRSYAAACTHLAQTNNPTYPTMHVCAPVIHPITGQTITTYSKLQRDPLLQDVWATAFGKEFGNLAQGDQRTQTPGTDAIFVLSPSQIKLIPADRVVTYTRTVVDYRPQKSDPNRVRLTAGGNLIQYPDELTTRTADLITTKILWNSVISTPGAKYMCIDIKNFYLGTPLTRYEYMKMPLTIFPQHIIDQYQLNENAYNGFVYLEIRKAIYGLPQAGILANKLLKQRLRPHGYYEVPHTPGLWKHIHRPIQFTLTVDDFGVKYVGREHAMHLISALQNNYELSIDWTGCLYCGITLDWDYDNRHVTLSMPKYISKMLTRFDHTPPTRPQHAPHEAPARTYGRDAQTPLPTDISPKLPPERVRTIQQIVGTALYYARAVDPTILVALSSIAAEQTNATEQTEKHALQLMDYLHTHSEAKIRYHASDMILNIHSDASYLSEPHAKSRYGGIYFMATTPSDNSPITINGAVHIHANICKNVIASAAEAELGALFHNCQNGQILRLILHELGHAQPPTPIHCDNATAVAIANDTVKKQRSRAMEMRYFWVVDKVQDNTYRVIWKPGQENLADYFTKHFHGTHHQNVRPWYICEPNSPKELPRAQTPQSLKGCVGELPNGYTKSSPLPQLRPDRHSRSQPARDRSSLE